MPPPYSGSGSMRGLGSEKVDYLLLWLHVRLETVTPA